MKTQAGALEEEARAIVGPAARAGHCGEKMGSDGSVTHRACDVLSRVPMWGVVLGTAQTQ